MQNAEPTTNREQRALARFAEVRRRKSLRSRVNAECKMQNAECRINNFFQWGKSEAIEEILCVKQWRKAQPTLRSEGRGCLHTLPSRKEEKPAKQD